MTGMQPRDVESFRVRVKPLSIRCAEPNCICPVMGISTNETRSVINVPPGVHTVGEILQMMREHVHEYLFE